MNMTTGEDVKLNDEERTRCEIWTRVMGYYRPVSAFNKGKQSEYFDRKYFHEKVRNFTDCGNCGKDRVCYGC